MIHSAIITIIIMFLLLKTAGIVMTPQTSVTVAAFIYMSIEHWSGILPFETKIVFLMALILLIGYRMEEIPEKTYDNQKP